MKQHLQFTIVVSTLFVTTAFAQRKLSPDEYIRLYKNDAIKEMQSSGVPASITIAQGMFESDNGNSLLAVATNNHFGIKCHKEWDGPHFYHDDDAKGECFRKYRNVLESYKDHSHFLKTRSRYAFLFQLPKTDYKAWAYGLKKAGYATNPKYPERLIKIIEDYQLFKYDKCQGEPCDMDVEQPEPSYAEQPNIESTEVSAATAKITPRRTPSSSSKNNENNYNLRIGLTNGSKFVVTRSGDSYYSIAEEFNLGLWQVLKYNEIEKTTPIKVGQKLYVEPKKRNCEQEYHIVKAGDTIYSISQLYGIKTKRLYKFNHMSIGEEPKPGTKLLLKKQGGSWFI